jgi:hypothetical protein
MADIADQVYLLSLKSQQAKESSFESNLTYLGNINERKITQFKETTVEGSHLRFQQAQTTTAKRWLSLRLCYIFICSSCFRARLLGYWSFSFLANQFGNASSS